MKHFLLLISIIFIAPIYCFCQPSPNVKIGSQIWQSKNLDVATFSNGDRIFEAKSIKDWHDAISSKQPAWCYYNFNPENGKKYGSAAGKIGSKKTNTQKWMCLETGYITNSGALTMYQKAKGIDTTKRERLE